MKFDKIKLNFYNIRGRRFYKNICTNNTLLQYSHHTDLNKKSNIYKKYIYYFHSGNMEVNKNKEVTKKPKEHLTNLKEKYNREALENVLIRRFFVVPAFEIYGGTAGLYDYGPPGCSLKQNIEQYWREHFILEENMLELGCTNLTIESVLKASGHVDKFSDYMVRDEKKGEYYRADKIIQEYIEAALKKDEKLNKMKQEIKDKFEYYLQEVDKMDGDQMDEVIKEIKVTSPHGNALSKCVQFNLMFSTQIGPEKGAVGYLRPETAQGQFVNFKRLLEYNGGKLPFASAVVGLGFRNEISPRSGLLRVREFAMAEIEHFLDPQNKSHKKFSHVKHLKLPLWSKEIQMNHSFEYLKDMTLGEAVESKIIDNETLAYFLGRTYIFLINIGINKDSIRFRQHLSKEMAHYASDCWDAEVETSHGWIEVVGHADRTCYDLESHSKATGKEHLASRPLNKPITHNKIRVKVNKPELAKNYKSKIKDILDLIDKLTEEEKESLTQTFEKEKKTTLKLNDSTIELNENLLSFERYTEVQTEEKFIPGVIEPAFGIGRIVYCVMEHCFRIRQSDNKRTFFAFPPKVSPYKVSILPLIYNDEIYKFIEPLRQNLVEQGITYKVDDIAEGIGKRYARTDEVGIPFAITIDEQTVKDGTVTLREIENMKQVRIHNSNIADIIKKCSLNLMNWDDIKNKYPVFESGKEEKEEKDI